MRRTGRSRPGNEWLRSALTETAWAASRSKGTALGSLYHRLARRRANRAFEDQSLDDVIRSIASDAGLQADVQAGSDQATWLQNNESDLAFLLRQLEPRDIGLRLQDGRLRARDDEADPRPARLTVGANAEKIRALGVIKRAAAEVNRDFGALEPQLAAHLPVFSTASAYRYEPDVPLILPGASLPICRWMSPRAQPVNSWRVCASCLCRSSSWRRYWRPFSQSVLPRQGFCST